MHLGGIEEWAEFVVIAFGITAIVFNPFIPIYLNDSPIWMAKDLLVGVLFTIKS